MARNALKVPEVHPLIKALEKHDEAAVELRGFLGTSEEDVVRLYNSLDTSSYVEIPKAAVVYLEGKKDGEPGEVRVFVAGEQSALQVRRLRVWELNAPLPPDELPPATRAGIPTSGRDFWSCAAECEANFGREAAAILVLEAQAALEPNPQRQQGMLLRARNMRLLATGTLFACLNKCYEISPPFLNLMTVPDESPQGWHYAPFTVAAYHQLLVERHLDRPEP